jgi:alpha-1,3-glucosyltransferase
MFNAGLLMVDHIHFQYNGMLMGLLIFALFFAASNRFVASSVAFTSLLFMKQLFLPLSPVFLVYFLKAHCFNQVSGFDLPSVLTCLSRVLKLGAAVICVAFAALLPFLLQDDPVGQLQQMLSLLFPFGRGLLHAYWAPNVWAIYALADRLLLLCWRVFPSLRKFKWLIPAESVSVTSGLVGDFGMSVLPSPRPWISIALLLCAITPALWAVWRTPQPKVFTQSLYLASYAQFMLSWQVHEKAIVIPMILLTLEAQQDELSARLLFRTTVAGVFSLFPLFFTLPERYIKFFLWLAFTVGTRHAVVECLQFSLTKLDYIIWLYFGVLFAYTEVGHHVLFANTDGSTRWEFLPNLLISCSCALVLVPTWLQSYAILFQGVQ